MIVQLFSFLFLFVKSNNLTKMSDIKLLYNLNARM